MRSHERKQLLARIEREGATVGASIPETIDVQGERLVESIVGIDRALNALGDLGTTDIEREADAKDAADRKRWMSFLKQALGNEDSNARR